MTRRSSRPYLARAIGAAATGAAVLVCTTHAFAQRAPSAPPPLPAGAEPAPAAPAPAPSVSPVPTPAPAPAEPLPAPAEPLPAPPSLSAPETDSGEGPTVAPTPTYDLVRLNLGYRMRYVPGAAFDQFSDDDVLAQVSLDGTYPLLARGRLVLAAGLGWDYGASSGRLRGLESRVAAHRLSVPIEARYHVVPSIALFGKVAPGATVALARVQDSSAPAELQGSGWAFSADASVGASFLLGPRQRLDERLVRFWVSPELGYGFMTKAPLELSPDREDDKDVLGTDEATRLRSLALSGFFWRLSVGLTF